MGRLRKKSKNPSSLTGEDQGEGGKCHDFKKFYPLLPFIFSREGRGKLSFYDVVKVDIHRWVTILPAFNRNGMWLNPGLAVRRIGSTRI
jgi:hypothetical protein